MSNSFTVSLNFMSYLWKYTYFYKYAALFQVVYMSTTGKIITNVYHIFLVTIYFCANEF